MPPASEEVCAKLREIFADPDPRAVIFTKTAETGGDRPDEGLEQLLRPLPLNRAREVLRQAIVHFLAEGGKANETHAPGVPERKLPPATFYEFRLTCENQALYIKVILVDANSALPSARVISVKKKYY